MIDMSFGAYEQSNARSEIVGILAKYDVTIDQAVQTLEQTKIDLMNARLQKSDKDSTAALL